VDHTHESIAYDFGGPETRPINSPP
jgi:hypothetical protein